MSKYKLGSLFDGSGGFPLAGSLCGIEPAWASEVEPYPIAVTRTRFPNMKHLGDISKINGGKVEPVDIITFGSPCQDLSVAGKRAGLKHEANGDEETTRSGLFMEAVRIIREMKEATHGQYPTYALWENVPGAFSSNGGEDFRIVLEELIKIVEPTASMPAVPKNGWPYADSYCGDGWSLAYRVFDAQYWGVPQRRRRIHLVLDLRGERAREVLFEREGVRGYFAEGRTPWQGLASHAENCTGADDRAGAVPYTLKIRSGCEGGGKGALVQEDKSATLATNNDQYLFQPIAFAQNQRDEVRDLSNKSGAIMAEPGMKQQTFIAIPVPVTLEPGIAAREGGHIYEGVSGTLRANAGDNQMAVAHPVPNLLLDDQGGQQVNVRTDDKCPTLRAEMHGNVPAVMCKTYEECAYACTTGSFMQVAEEVSPTLMARDWKDPTCVAYQDKVGALCARDYKGVGSQYVSEDKLVIAPTVRYIVRRLTPTECARLQGFADRWGDIDEKTEFTDEEYNFWLEVRNTHATVIGGREAKEYTKEQMLKWYNSLHTDSAEYKMWGNGIALPPALYCMQGIREALDEYAEMPAVCPDPKVDVDVVEEVEEPAVESICEGEPIHEEEPTPAVDPEKEKMRETLLDVAKVFGEMAQHILEVCK